MDTPFRRADTAVHLGDHPARHDAVLLQCRNLVCVDHRNERAFIVRIPEHTARIGQENEVSCLECHRDFRGCCVRVDVVDPGAVRCVGNGGDNRNVALRDYVLNHRCVHGFHVPDKAVIGAGGIGMPLCFEQSAVQTA